MPISRHQKITQTLLLGIFFLVPIIFFPISVWLFSFGYERYKVIFLLCMAVTLGIISFIYATNKNKILGTITISLVGGTLFFIIWNYLWGLGFVDFLLGTAEKLHGMLFFACLLVIFLVLKKYQSTEFYKKVETVTLWSGGIISLYAILQFAGIDFVPVQYVSSGWSLGRVFSTLGNPNYLAGYLLLLFPILASRDIQKMIGYWLIFGAALILTGSVVGIFLGSSYVIFRIVKNYIPQYLHKKIFLSGVTILGILFFAIFSLGQSQKLLSFESRISLANTLYQTEKQAPIGLIFGHGPDTILSAISGGKVSLDTRYFQSGSVIDSFHNVFLDWLFFFGFPIIIYGMYIFIGQWKKLSIQSKEAISLFFLFFLMNIPISVHYLLLVFFLSSESKK